ncbi:MAG: Hsp33 family molecular chaperone HslO [Eubacterium sp.]|nr:Hsp33 family molecular chaperone HslO [Eubacterium sp.]
MSKSKVLIGIDKSGSYRVHLTITTGIVEEARKIHNCSPLAIAGLGRVLTATGMMAIELKGEGNKATVLFKGDGPAKQILATGYGTGQIKGYISNPDVDLPLKENGKLDVGGSIGIGDLTVIKDLGLKEPYVGSIALVSGEIADDLTAYYFISEQQNTSIALGVKVGVEGNVIAAGGMFIQMLPNADEEAIDELEKLLADVKPMTTNIEEVILAGGMKSEEGLLVDLMEKIFGGIKEEFKPEVLEYKEMELKCDCSRERMEGALMTIGRHDLTEILEEDGQAELECHFCGKKYLFNEEDLKEMLSNM